MFDIITKDSTSRSQCTQNPILIIYLIHGEEPGEEIDGVALVDVPEDLVEVVHDVHEVDVVVVEGDAAHVAGEHVGARGLDQRLDGEGRGRGVRAHALQQPLSLDARHRRQLPELRRREARRAVEARDAPARLLQVRPVTQRQGCQHNKNEKFNFGIGTRGHTPVDVFSQI